jgi:CP family cyanate transporter-like MFS transporter
MLFSGWLLYFSFGLIYTAVAPLVSPIMQELRLTYTQMGAITGAWQLVYIFSAQPLGLMVDRLGIRHSLLLGAVIMPVSSILRGFSYSFEGLLASVALFGLGGPLISVGTTKLVSVWFTGRERSIASGINASAPSAGSIAALGLTNSLALPLVGSWRGVFFIYGLVGFATALVWYLESKKNPPQGSEGFDKGGRADRSPISQLLKNRTIWSIIAIGIVYFLTTHSLQNWLPSILSMKGFSTVQAGYATSLMTLSGILGGLIVPRFMVRPRRMKLVIASILAISGASILITGLGTGLDLWFAIVTAGFFTRSLMPILTVTLMNMPEIGPQRMGAIGGLFFSMGEIGGFTGPFMMGYLRDTTNSFQAGTLFLAVVTWISVSFTSVLRTRAVSK